MKDRPRFEFRPGFWPTLATLVLLPLLLALGFWQLDRAAEKARMQQDFEARYQRPRVDLNAMSERDRAERWLWRAVRLRGEYLDRSYLLDNQVRNGGNGYRLYTPLRLSGLEAAVLVERDWLPVGADRRHAPEVRVPAGAVTINGRVVPAPATGLLFGKHRIETLAPGVHRVQRIDLAELARHSGTPLLPYVVRDSEAPHARSDLAIAMQGFGRERHLGYAFQWFALAVTLLVIYIAVNIRKRKT